MSCGPRFGECAAPAGRRDRGFGSGSKRRREAAEEVVQLYVHDRAASIARRVRELKDFRKVGLAPGESATVGLALRREDPLFAGQASGSRSSRGHSSSGSARR
jgi:beta-glucosidase